MKSTNLNRACVAAGVTMCVGGSVALGGGGLVLIRPTGATASSEFSALYDIGNTIEHRFQLVVRRDELHTDAP